jgi:hypothetical protein
MGDSRHSLFGVCLLTGVVGLLATYGSDVAADDMVPFVIPAKVDGKSLIAIRGEPIAADGPRIVARDGHFFVGKARMKVWGVNFCFGANFPTHADAERIASRLEAFGVNSVRLHHMDSQPYPSGISFNYPQV